MNKLLLTNQPAKIKLHFSGTIFIDILSEIISELEFKKNMSQFTYFYLTKLLP